mmetsp:Transcript_1905/g.4024  ORF Transcript_1905/g.4024 Transcript_1905/m.4024 type:complete len:94 (-) Transcript_1905:79-360(-)
MMERQEVEKKEMMERQEVEKKEMMERQEAEKKDIQQMQYFMVGILLVFIAWQTMTNRGPQSTPKPASLATKPRNITAGGRASSGMERGALKHG